MSVLFLNINFKGNDQLSNALEKIGSAAEKLQSKISDTQKKLVGLEKFHLKNDKFIKLKADFEKNSQALDNNRKKVAALQQQLAKGGGKQLAQELKKAESETKKLENAVSKGKSELLAYRQELNQAGFKGKSFADVQGKIRENIDKTNASLQKQQAKLEKLENAQANWDSAKKRAGNALMVATGAYQLGMQTATALAVPVKLAIDGEKSMADVAKVVDGLKIDGKVTQEYHQFEAQMTQMSNRLGKSFADVSAIVANGAQGGIAKNELMQFAESTSKISVAWDMSASDVGQSIAELRSTLKLSQNDVEHLADQINYLGNNSTNNAAHILEVVQRVGSVGAAAGVSGELVAAMGASLSGIDPSSASTGLKNIIKSLTKGDSATKSQRKAWEALGTTAEKMAVDMLKDPEKAIKNYIEMLNKLPEEQRLAFASMISNDEALPVLAQMMNDPTKFQSYASDLKDKNKVGGSVDAEYQSATSTTAAKIETAKVKLQNFGKDFGKHLLPAVGKIADGFSAIVDKISAWTQAHPQLAKYLAMAAVGVMAILMAVTAVAGAMALLVMPFAGLNLMIAKASGGALSLGGIFKGLLSPVASLKTAFGAIKTVALSGFGKLGVMFAKIGGAIKSIPTLLSLVRTGFMMAAGGVKAFSVALLTNPITWAVAAIAGLAFVIYKYWNPIKAFLAGVWDGIKAGLAPLMSAFSGLGSYISPVINWFKNLFNITQVGEGNARSLGQAFGGGLVAAFNALTAPIQAVWRLLKWLWDSISGLFSGQISIGDIFADLWAKFDGAVAKITEWKDKAVKLWDDFWSVFKSNKSDAGAGGSAGGDGGGFWSSLASGFETAKNTISEKAGGIWESAKSKFETAKATLSAKAGEIWSSVTNVMGGSGGADIGTTINTKAQAILVAMGAAAATISTTFTALLGVVSASVIGIITVIGTAFAGVPAVFAAALSTLPAIAASTFAILAAAVGAGMAVIATVVTARMTAVAAALQAGFTRIRQVVATAWRQLGSAMSGNPILTKIQSAMNATLSYLNGIKGRFSAIGADIAGGLAAGMNSRLGELRKTAAQMAAVVEDASRKRLDTHSPSRVMAAVGRDVVAGLDVGMSRRFAPMLKNFSNNIGKLANPANLSKVVNMADNIVGKISNSANLSKAVNMADNIGAMMGSDDVVGDLMKMVAPSFSHSMLGNVFEIGAQAVTALARTQPKPAAVTPLKSASAMTAEAIQNSTQNSTSSSNVSINVQASPGMDERTLAMRVREELDKFQAKSAARHRARLTD